MSDFATPKYYQVGQSLHGPYSFRGQIKKPLDVLTGGYISWRKYPPSGLIYQAISETNEAQLRDKVFAGAEVKAVPEAKLKRKVVGGSSRFSIDAQRSRDDARRGNGEARPPDFPRHEQKATPQATLRADIEALLAWVTFQATEHQPKPNDVIRVLEDLVDHPDCWKAFNEKPNVRQDTLTDLNIPLTHRDPSSRISVDTLRQVLDYLKEQRDADARFGESGDSVFGLWMAVQIG
ncbi:MAG: hypothetical protein JO262_21750 [Solirubrobacterales bacterium]|nr:hypothetical protein [Solirubrobacterales bacterium]